VLRLLSLESPVNFATLVFALEIGDRAVRRHLSKLKDHGLVKKEGMGWLRTGRSVEEVADDLGVAGSGARQRLQYEEQQAMFRAFIRRNPTTAGERIRRAIDLDKQLGSSHRAETLDTLPPAAARAGDRRT